jgi:hypothetical protein
MTLNIDGMLKVLGNIHFDPLKTNVNFKILIPQFSSI